MINISMTDTWNCQVNEPQIATKRLFVLGSFPAFNVSSFLHIGFGTYRVLNIVYRAYLTSIVIGNALIRIFESVRWAPDLTGAMSAAKFADRFNWSHSSLNKRKR